jgi:hypothetical protein
VPPYNGGLFSDETPATELLDRAILPDADFAPLLDRLARTDKDGRRVRIRTATHSMVCISPAN